MSNFECKVCGYEVHEEFKEDHDDRISEIECRAILAAIESFNDGAINGFNAVDLYEHCRSVALAKVGLGEEL